MPGLRKPKLLKLPSRPKGQAPVTLDRYLRHLQKVNAHNAKLMREYLAEKKRRDDASERIRREREKSAKIRAGDLTGTGTTTRRRRKSTAAPKRKTPKRKTAKASKPKKKKR